MPRPYSTPALRAERRLSVAVAGVAVRAASDAAVAAEQVAALNETLADQSAIIEAQGEAIAEQAATLEAIDARVRALEP